MNVQVGHIFGAEHLEQSEGGFTIHPWANGVNGGIDGITHTIRPGVDTFIHRKEAENKLPTKALVPLDIKNMFNEMSLDKNSEKSSAKNTQNWRHLQISYMKMTAVPVLKCLTAPGLILQSAKGSPSAALCPQYLLRWYLE